MSDKACRISSQAMQVNPRQKKEQTPLEGVRRVALAHRRLKARAKRTLFFSSIYDLHENLTHFPQIGFVHCIMFIILFFHGDRPIDMEVPEGSQLVVQPEPSAEDQED